MKQIQAISLATCFIAGLLSSTTLLAADASKAPLPMSSTQGQGFSREGLKKIDAFFCRSNCQ